MNRFDQVNQAFMLWVYDNQDRHPNPEDALNLGAVAPGGEPLTPDEVETCATYLASRDLITGVRVNEVAYPLRVYLTADGLQCVHEHGGDVAEWVRSQQPQQNYDQSVSVIAGRDAQVAAHSQNVNQAQNKSAVKVDDLVKAARAVRELLPVLSDHSIDTAEVDGIVTEIEDEAASGQPDPGNLRRLGERLLALVGPAADTLTIAQFAVGGVMAALG